MSFANGIDKLSDKSKNVFYHSQAGQIQEGEKSEPVGWYFITETQADYCGPYPTEDAALEAINDYAKHL